MTQTAPKLEEFLELLNENFAADANLEGRVTTGKIIAIEKGVAIVDIGLKTEGRIDLKEFEDDVNYDKLQLGSKVEVYVERIENSLGEAVISREKARREESWEKLESLSGEGSKVNGKITHIVKGGYMVDLQGVTAFLPRSQVDIRPIRDISPLMNVEQPFAILKLDRRRSNVVVSRRAILEEDRAESRSEIVSNLAEGQVIEGIVKNITDYGAFVDLGGVDGLLHVTDISWTRVNHPSEVINIGDKLNVKIIRIHPDTHRISLGMKQLDSDPWVGIEGRVPVNTKFKGKVTNIADYGAFVEIEEGIEGLIHVSEMSWGKKAVNPTKILSIGQEVEVMVLEVDMDKRRISLGLKQTSENPWAGFAASHEIGETLKGVVKNKTEFGLFVGLEGDVDGLVHLNDLDWNIPGEQAMEGYEKGQEVEAVLLDVDVEKERISLGIKQLGQDGFADAAGDVKKGQVVTCEVLGVKDGGLDVKLANYDITTFIKRNDLSKDRSEQRPERFAVGDKFDARVTQFDAKARRVTVSVKALEVAEEKEAIAQYGSTDSGASLGDILGAALGAAADKDKK